MKNKQSHCHCQQNVGQQKGPPHRLVAMASVPFSWSLHVNCSHAAAALPRTANWPPLDFPNNFEGELIGREDYFF